MELTKQEIRDIKEYEKDFSIMSILPYKKARGKTMQYLIMVCHGRRELHDAGYPFIKAIGVGYDTDEKGKTTKKKYYELGWHDHYVVYRSSNTDCFGKNIFRLMPWADKGVGWMVSEHFISSSSLMIGDFLEKGNIPIIT